MPQGLTKGSKSKPDGESDKADAQQADGTQQLQTDTQPDNAAQQLQTDTQLQTAAQQQEAEQTAEEEQEDEATKRAKHASEAASLEAELLAFPDLESADRLKLLRARLNRTHANMASNQQASVIHNHSAGNVLISPLLSHA